MTFSDKSDHCERPVQVGHYGTRDAGGVLIGGKLGKPGKITQLVREPCIVGEILGHIQAAAQLSQVQY